MIWFLLGWLWLYVWFYTALMRSRARRRIG